MDDFAISPDKPRRFRWLSGWSRLFLDMLAITFGVLLAFGLNAWWEGRRASEFNARSLALVKAEIARNGETLTQSIDYREKIYPGLVRIEAGLATIEDVPFRGTRPPSIERAAYELAQSNAVFAELDAEMAEQIIDLYMKFDRIEGTHQMYAGGMPEIIVNATGPNDPRTAIFLKMAFTDFMYAEGEALNSIRGFQGETEDIVVWDRLQQLQRDALADTSAAP